MTSLPCPASTKPMSLRPHASFRTMFLTRLTAPLLLLAGSLSPFASGAANPTLPRVHSLNMEAPSDTASGACPSQPQAQALQPLTERLQTELEAFVRESGIPGATLAVILPDGRVLPIAAGLADREESIPMRPDHRLFTGSIGKTWVAALALQLCAEGRLSLDSPVSRYLGREPWFARIPNHEAITIRQLLSHTTGIPEHVQKPALWQNARSHPDQVPPMPDLLAHIFGDPPLFAAGTAFSYADTNYILLGLVEERITKRPYYEEIRRRFLDPLALRDTLPADRRDLPGLASGYSERGEPFATPGKVTEKGRYYINPALEWTGGGLITTASDLARWASLLFGGNVLPGVWLERMVTPSPHPTDLPGGARYGLGSFIWESPFGTAYGHSGFVPGYNAMMAYLPKRHLAIALLCNTDTAFKRCGTGSTGSVDRFLKLVLPAEEKKR